ncbi:MAG: hypothetical protein NWF01_03950 [Candidatus Bathyarchaeota archaeon]|nr:hypothetical protein [Candidatus Bathyarchaeota archaeon]
MFTQQQNVGLQDTISQTQQLNADRTSEDITVSDMLLIPTQNNIDIYCQIFNSGPIATNLVSLWANDIDSQTHNSIPISVSLQPGESKNFNILMNLDGAQPSDEQIAAWFVTARGNLIPIVEAEDDISELQLPETGSIKLDWRQIKYYDFGIDPPLSGAALPATATYGCTIPSNHYVLIAAVLTNLDPEQQPITLTNDTYIYAIAKNSHSGNPHDNVAFSMNIAAVNGNHYSTTFTTQTLMYNEPVMVYFGVDTYENDILPFNMVLFGYTSSGAAYGQNIPFVTFKFSNT